MRRVVLLGVLLAAAAAAAPPATAARSCDPTAEPALQIAATARLTGVVGGKVAPFGAERARALARELGRAGDVCAARATPAVAAALKRVERAYAAGDRAGAKRLFTQVLASIRARRAPSSVPPRTAAAVAGKCAVDKEIHVRPRDAPKVGDYLAAAKTAQKAKDQAGSDAATAGAQKAYSDWAGKAGAKSTSDYVSIATGAQQLGLDGTAKDMLDQGRTAAEKDVEKAGEIDSCTVSQADYDCQLRAISTAQLLGADVADAAARLAKISEALVDRLQRKIPEGCEEWSFEMTLRDPTYGWSIRWGTGKFRVSRKTGTLDGAYAGGVGGGGWPGLLGDLTGDCIEETDAGPVNHGPGTLRGGAFRYQLGGSVTDDGFTVSVSSDGGLTGFSGPSELWCQVLLSFGALVVDAFVKGPYDLEFALAPGETSKTVGGATAEGEFTATIRRTKP